MTAPTVQVLAVSGFKFRLPPVVRFAWAHVGLVIRPICEAGAPWAIQIARRLGSLSAGLSGTSSVTLAGFGVPAQGSTARLVKTVVTGVNNSEMFGARTARL